MMRTDQDLNPTAFTTDIARQAGLVLGVHYIGGSAFPPPSTLTTAKLLGDPVAITIRVIDAVGYYTRDGEQRWDYISIPKFVWLSLSPEAKRDVIGWMYEREGGTAMRSLFPNYGAV